MAERQIATDAAAVGATTPEAAAKTALETGWIKDPATRIKENQRDLVDRGIGYWLRMNTWLAAKPWFSRPVVLANKVVESGQAAILPAVAAAAGTITHRGIPFGAREWAQTVADAWNGKREITGSDFLEILHGRAMAEELGKINLRGMAPAGVGALINTYLAVDDRVKHLLDLPPRDLSMGDLVGGFEDLLVDPTLAAGFTPIGFMAKPAQRVARAAANTGLGRVVRGVAQSRLAGLAETVVAEPLNVLEGTQVAEEAINRNLNFMTKLRDVDVPRWKDWAEAKTAHQPAAPVVYPRSYRTTADFHSSYRSGTPYVPSGVKANLNAVASGRMMVGEIAPKTAVPGTMVEFSAGGRRFVVGLGAPTAKLAAEFDAILAGPRTLARSIKLRQAMGWREGDINAWIALQGVGKGRRWTLSEVNNAWGAATGMQGRRSTLKSSVSAPIAPLQRNSPMDHKVGEWLLGYRTLSSFTKNEQLWLKDLGNHVADLRQVNGLPRDGLLRDMGKLVSSDHGVPADLVANLSPRTARELLLPKGKRPLQMPSKLSAHELMQDFMYLSRRKEAFDPFVEKWRSKAVKKAGVVTETNADLAALPRGKRVYVQELVDQVVGKPRGRAENFLDESIGAAWAFAGDNIAAPTMKALASAFDHVSPGFAAGLRAHKPMPLVHPVQKLSLLMQRNMVRMALGGKISTSIGNAFIIQNTATRKGIPATLRGVVQILDPAHRVAMRESGLMQAWHGIMEHSLLQKSVMERLDQGLLAGFNMTEWLGKAVAFNVAAEEFAASKGAQGLADFLTHATQTEKQSLLEFARMHAIQETHLYGWLGRPPATNNPFLRPLTTLLSFAPKQANFLRRQLHSDPSGLLRYFATSAVLIDKLDEAAGVDASAYTGLGFLPMTHSLEGIPLILSPEASLTLDWFAGWGLAGSGKHREARERLMRVALQLPAAFVPLPAGAVVDWAEAFEEWQQGSRPTAGGGMRESGRAEALSRLFFPSSTLDSERRGMAMRGRAVESRVDFELDRKARRYAKALTAEPRRADQLADALADLLTLPEVDGQPVPVSPDALRQRIMGHLKRDQLDADTLRYLDLSATMKFFLREDQAKIDALKRRRGVGKQP